MFGLPIEAIGGLVGIVTGVAKSWVEIRGALESQRIASQKALTDALLAKLGAIDANATAAAKRTERVPWIMPAVVCVSMFSVLLLPAMLAFFGVPIGLQTETETAATAFKPAQVFDHWVVLWGYPISREALAVFTMAGTHVLGAMPSKLINRV